MGLTNTTIQKASRIKETVYTYFEESNDQSIQAKELMPLFIKKGLFNSNHRDGSPIRNLLRLLDKEGQLALIPQVHFEQKSVNKNWFFI